MNDDEVEDFARLTLEYPLWVRFIELMPLGENGAWEGHRYLPVSAVWPRLQAVGTLDPLDDTAAPGVGGGPARYFTYRGAPGRLGLITPMSRHFCSTCNRLRLTADGRLNPCLARDTEVDVRGPLRAGADRAELAALIRQAVLVKPARHRMADEEEGRQKQMSRLGG
ncbi:MAG TPA: hypothetical protein GX513_03550 [Firmicutes bacterium]|nr:hypothetical protein [Bacillota bacterium]